MTGSNPLSLNRAATLSLTANVLSARRASAISTLETNADSALCISEPFRILRSNGISEGQCSWIS